MTAASSSAIPLRSPVSSAVTKAAVSPSGHMAAIFSRRAYTARWGSHRMLPALPSSAVSGPRAYSRANTPREVKAVTSFSRMRAASCHWAVPESCCPGSKPAYSASA
ncbi:MAG: hypothetical protein V8S77_06530 [Oscillospiraceae bacterium]